MEINAIVAIDKLGCIGHENDLVFKSKKDMKLFKQSTSNQIVVMGSKTYSSMGSRPLPNRVNVVLSRKLVDDNVLIYDDIHKMLDDMILTYPDKQIWIIGGSEVYKLFMEYDMIDNFYITRFNHVSEKCDTHFPMELLSNYELKSSIEEVDGDLEISFQIYTRNNI
jgi:dihydrofolate reductase